MTFGGTYQIWCKSWFSDLQSFLLGALALMTLIGMTLEQTGPVKYVFWAFFTPVTIWVLVRRGGYHSVWSSVPLRWAFALLLLYLVSTMWSVPTSPEEKSQVLTHTLLTIVFVIGVFLALRAPRVQRLRFARIVIIACVLGALVSIIGFYTDHSWATRLYSKPSLLRHPSLAPAVMLGCLMVAGLLMAGRDVSHRGWWLPLGFVAVGAYAFLAQTRGVLISYGFLMVLWGWYYLGAKRVLLVVGLLLVAFVVGVLLTHSLEKSWANHMSSGLNGRLVIWKGVLREFMDMPLFGHGAASIFPDTAGGRVAVETLSNVVPHPHGLFPSMLFYFGVVGAAVMVAYLVMLAKGFYYCLRQAKWLGGSALVCMLLMTSMDVHTLVSEVGRNWWFWWLPTITMVVVADQNWTSTETQQDI